MAGTQSNSWESRRLEIPFSSLLPTLMQQRAEGKSSLTHWEAVDGSRGSVQDTFIIVYHRLSSFIIVYHRLSLAYYGLSWFIHLTLIVFVNDFFIDRCTDHPQFT